MKKKVNVVVILGIFLTGSLFADNLLVNPGFEDRTPAFWAPLNGTMGTELEVEATADNVFAGLYSFKITKSAATTAAVGWLYDHPINMLWAGAEAATYELKAMVKTDGVNTDPADDDAKIGVTFEFLDADGNALVTAQTLWADQTSASVDWDTLSGVAILTTAPTTIKVTQFMGKDATGTVYLDDVNSNWKVFNAGAETVEGWLNWYGSGNGSYGTVTNNLARSGSYAAELYKPDTTASTSEIVYYSLPAAVEAGEWYKVSVWVKTEDVNWADTLESTYIRKERIDARIGLCYFFHQGNLVTDFTTLGGDKYVYIDQTDSTTGWIQYSVAEQAPEDATGISVRARFTSNPTGKAYFDDFSVVKMIESDPVVLAIDDGNESYRIPTGFKLSQNYPNPFNPTTMIELVVPHDEWINLTIYNLLGQKVRTLVNGIHAQGRYLINWDAQNEFGQKVTSGIYLYTLTTKDTRITKKMLLVR